MRSLKQKPTLIINPLVKEKMNQLVSKSDKEVAWHGFVKRDDMTFTWYDIILYPQHVSGASVVPDDDEYAEWIDKQAEFANFEEMRLHGHSHVNMACSPSGTDLEYRRNMVKQLRDDDFYIFLIINKKGSYTIEIYDKLNEIVFEEHDINIVVVDPRILEEADKWSTQVIKNNVKEIKPKCLTTSKASSSSTQKKSTPKYTSSDVEPWEGPWSKYLYEPV